MIDFKLGIVIENIDTKTDLCELLVEVEGSRDKAINYLHITGEAKAGDQVLLNTTAVSKKLGTGGYHFVASVVGKQCYCQNDSGHIMKMRYTPFQVKVLTVEEKEHPYNSVYNKIDNLDEMPVIVGSLHSMIAPAAAMLKYLTGKKIFYLMTDGAALPIWYSKLVSILKHKKIIDKTITCGHAFGGDFEAVNIYSGLLFAKAAGADTVIVSMGPGIVGTSSQFGHTGLEQGEIINAVNIMSGRAIAIPRISFADPRDRHYGLSHHTKTSLGKIALTPCIVPIPRLENTKRNTVLNQISKAGISNLHKTVEIDTGLLSDVLEHYQLQVTTMGRPFSEDMDFFSTAGAAGIYASGLININKKFSIQE